MDAHVVISVVLVVVVIVAVDGPQLSPIKANEQIQNVELFFESLNRSCLLVKPSWTQMKSAVHEELSAHLRAFSQCKASAD